MCPAIAEGVEGRSPDAAPDCLKFKPETHLEKPPHFLFLVCPTSAQAVAWRETLAGSASSSADLPLPRLSPYLCCWALGSECGNHPRKNMCPGSEPPSAVHQAPREQVTHIFLFSCLQQERMKEKKYPAASTVSLRAIWEFQDCLPLECLTMCFCTIFFCPWFPAKAFQVCPDTPGEWQIGSATG